MNETEHSIQTAILEYLLMAGHYVWRNNSGALRTGKHGERLVRFGKKGSADIIGCTKTGQFLAVEVKKKGNKPTELQQAFLEEIRAHGGMALVAYSVDDVIEAFST